ncbi:hypothetical protein M514_05285 [Trichuris suis]|uniref:Uncharacterized protein n=1 Tax=Trichuris suis TaxID=68888 RepID=A0A085M983_9BILA|nr:hypothetical protein M513_05285 [Trichuris suis]KFD71575.1 hypothetical protein M514_05285 [Trichuris suis]
MVSQPSNLGVQPEALIHRPPKYSKLGQASSLHANIDAISQELSSLLDSTLYIVNGEVRFAYLWTIGKEGYRNVCTLPSSKEASRDD